MERYSAIISVGCTFLALLLSLYIAYRTIPKERPFISLVKNEAQGNLDKSTNMLNINLLLLFKNNGGHPAKDVEILISGGIIGNEQSFCNITKQTIANVIGSDNIFNWNQNMKLKPVAINEGKLIYEESDCIFLVRINYKDSFSFMQFSQKYTSEFWITYKTGRASAAHATSEEVNISREKLLRCIQ